MKTKILTYQLFFSFFLVLFHLQGMGQVNIQVKILPPYQRDIAEYASRPDLILLTLTNTTTSEQSIQLRGSITGDNGISLSVKPSYRSPNAVILGPMETKILNGNDIAQLFNYKRIDYSGINANHFINGQGLPEGNYNFCVRAFDYNDPSIALSPDEPMGCTILSITNLEPPTIISPFNDQEIINTGVQTFVITWATPPGAPPSIQYNVRLTEIVVPRDPNEAMWSTSPIFERTVHGNSMLYGPAEPQLTPGRRYALAVEAIDPFQKFAFRNQGRSEVTSFVFGENVAIAGLTPSDSGQTAKPKESFEIETEEKIFATNRITGKLLWAFRESETAYVNSINHPTNSPTRTPAGTVVTAQNLQVPAGINNFAFGNVNSTLVNPVTLGKIDPTINTNFRSGLSVPLMGTTVNQSTNKQPAVFAGAVNPIATVVAFTGTASVGIQKVPSALKASSRTRPLSGMKVSISGRRKSAVKGTKSDVLLATGETDENGNFSVEIVNPKFVQLNNFADLVISVKADNFESFEYKTSTRALAEKTDIELGEHVLIAKTYRFNPSFVIDGQADLKSNLEVTLYRDAAEIEANLYLNFEGNLNANERVSKTINGKKMIVIDKAKVSSDKMGAAQFAPIFYSNSIWVEVIPELESINTRNTRLTVDDTPVSKEEVLVMKPQYKLSLRAPSLTGEVKLQMAAVEGSGGGTIPVQGAYVQVTYKKEDLLVPEAVAMVYTPMIQGVVGVTSTSNAKPPVTTGSTKAPAVIGTVATASTFVTSFTTAATSSAGSSYALPGFTVNNTAVIGNKAPIVNVPLLNASQLTYSLDAPYTVQTDSTGTYHIGNLPVLKKGAIYTVRVIQLPNEYSRMPITPADKKYDVVISAGKIEHKSFTITPEMMTVKGRVLDENNAPVTNARINFKGSSAITTTDDQDGTFETTFYAGEHTLVITKPGYVTLEHAVQLKKEVPKSGSTSTGNTMAGNILVTPKGASAGLIKLPSVSIREQLVTASTISAKTHVQQAGDIGPLIRQVGKVRFTIQDFDNISKKLQGVEISIYDTTNVTNTSGQWLYEGFSGEAVVTVTPDPTSGYVASQHSIEIHENGEITEVTIGIKQGVKVFGKVMSSNVALENADITIDGKPYLKATSNAEGLFSIYLPAGEEIVKAGKSGYFTETENKELVRGQETELNFTLRDGEGKNISTLLGFDIQLEDSKENTEVSGGAIWKGKFVNLQANPELFKGTSTAELPFEKLKVTFDADGNAIPEKNEVVTTANSLRIKLFDYLPLIMFGDEFIKVKLNPDRKGSISGQLKINGREWQRKNLGIYIGDLAHTYITPNSKTGIVDVEVFHQDINASVPEFTFQLARLDSAINVELYGFELTLDKDKSRISQLGLHVVGSVKTPELGIIKSTLIEIEDLRISKEFGVESLKIKEKEFDIPTIKIGEWSASLGTIKFNEDGFKLGGDIKFKIPKSEEATLAYNNLLLAKDAIFGGEFKVPDAGISVYDIIKLHAQGNPLAFAKVGNTPVYSLGGAATFAFEKLITQEIKIPNFQVQTDGKFYMQAPVNFSANLSFASLEVTGIEVSNPAIGDPFIGVIGEFKADVPMLKFEASDIRFSVNKNKKVDYTVSEIKAKLEVPIIDIGLGLQIIDTEERKGFKGKGTLGVPNTPLSADVDFKFSKLKAGGIELGANFVAGAVIPIGVVSINKLGGGVNYNSGKKIFGLNIKGQVSVTGLDAAAKFDNIDLGVTASSAGVLVEGSVDVVVASVLDLARAEIRMSTAEKRLLVKVDATFAPLPDIAEAKVSGIFGLKWDPNDTYAFLGAQMKANILGFTPTVDYAVAFNVKNPKNNSDPDISKFFTKLDDKFNRPVFTGVYLNADVEAKDSFGGKVWIFHAKASYQAHLNAMFLLNFGNKPADNVFVMRLRGHLAFAASAGIKWFDVGSSAQTCFLLEGGFNNGWYLDGKAGISLEMFAGDDCGCNDWVFWGVKGCIDAHGYFSYKNRKFSYGGDLGKVSGATISCY